MSEIVFSPAIEPMPAMDNVELGLVMAVEQDFIVASGADDLVVESSGISLTFSPVPASVTFTSFAGLGDEYVWYCPTLDPDAPWDCITTGINLNLTPQNASVTSDQDGEAYTFSGSSTSYATNFAKVTNRSEFSYSFWVKGSASSSEVVGVVGQSNIDNARGSIVGSYQNSSQGGNGSKVHFFYQSSPSSYNSDQRLQSIATVFDSTWHHVVVTFQGGSRVNIYVDGVLDRTTSSSVPSQIADVWRFELGRYAGSNGFSGSLDDVRVFTRAITAAEVSWLATARGVQGPPPPPPVGLGDEKLWLAPTFTGNVSNLALETGSGVGSSSGPVAVVADPDGSTESVYNFNSTSASYRITWTGGSYQTYSVAFWYRNSQLSRHQYVMSYAASVQVFQFAHPLNSSYGYSYAWNDSNQPAAGDFLYDDTWHHCVYQRSGYGAGGTSKFYADGLLVFSGTPDGSQNGSWAGNYLDIGTQQRSSAGPTNWSGYLDDFRFYERLISDEEIAWLASARNIQGPPVSGYLNPFTNPVFQNQFFTSKVIR